MHDTSRRPHCALSLRRLHSHPPSQPTTTLSRSLSATPIHHLCKFSSSRTRSLLAKLLFLKDTGRSSSSSSFSRCESAAPDAADASTCSLIPRPALLTPRPAHSPLDLPTHPSTCPLTPRPALSSLDLPSHPSTCPPRVRVARRDKLVETFAQPLAGLSSSLAVLIDVD